MIGPGETKETEASRAKDGFAGWRLWLWMNLFGIWMVAATGRAVGISVIVVRQYGSMFLFWVVSWRLRKSVWD